MKKTVYFIMTAVFAVIIMSFSASAASTAGKVQTEGGNLNVRSKPSSSGSIITSIKNKSWLTLKGKQGNWYLAEYAPGKEAYVSADYIKNYTTSYIATVKLKSGYLNVRKGAGTSYSVKDKLYDGEKVIVVKSNNSWSGIVYKGNKTGYVAKSYLVKDNAENESAISLSVPSYKQTDSRWKDYPIGTTGGTIGTIGCTTTALAMTESYYKGYAVTPVDMAKRLSYSASGSLYWPSDYSVTNASSDYLNVIYEKLKSGKPVVFGMKTAKGNQHWVTVYGYNGSGSLKTSDFLVHDPGSASRNTIESVMNHYPNPYRIVYKK